MKKKVFFTVMALVCILGAEKMTAQIEIGSHDTSQPFSLLELVSGDDKGMRLPQITTTAQRDIAFTDAAGFKDNPLAKGLQIFNLETGCVETWNGTKWILFCDDSTDGGGLSKSPSKTATIAVAEGDATASKGLTDEAEASAKPEKEV